MNIALPFTRVLRPAFPALPLSLLALLGVARLLPTVGYDMPATLLAAPVHILTWSRLALLAACYGLVAAATFRRSRHTFASASAILCAAALGWAGWEWSSASAGWSVFAALVALLEWRGRWSTLFAGGLLLGWAFLESSAVWGALLLIAALLDRRDSEIRWRLLLVAAGVLGLAVLHLRDVDIGAALLPPVRPWVWADNQATNKLGDPAGFALFAGVLAFLGIVLTQSGRRAPLDLLRAGIFIYFAWQARRNGIWLGMALAPTVAACLAGCVGRSQLLAIGGVAVASAGLLLLALRTGGALIGGEALSPNIISLLPAKGTIVYRPSFEPALQSVRPAPNLFLAAASADEASMTDVYDAWLRIETNCRPAQELDALTAQAVVLDSRIDTVPIAALTANGAWKVAADEHGATILLRAGAAQ